MVIKSWNSFELSAELLGFLVSSVSIGAVFGALINGFLIDKIGGVFIEDCEAFSRAIDPLLDENDVVDCQYCLEVSSCGADRKLSKPEHYKTAIGERIKLNFFTKIDGVKTTVGVLKEYTAESVTLEVNGEEKIYNKKDISSAKIDIDYDKLFS